MVVTSRSGDLWLPGERRLLCGDATSTAGGAAYESFSGRGTTLMASQKAERRVPAMELDLG